MLTTLRIKNFALVDDLTIEWHPGYNVITGETGAGKSILIGALTLLLGERADRTLIRDGADSCSVEAAFDVTRLKAPLGALLENNGLEQCQDGQLVLKRSFTAAGTNRQFVNGSPTTLKTLGDLGEWLVDIHGPHEHQSLLRPVRQLAIVDAFGGLDSLRDKYAEVILKYRALEAEKTSLIVDEKTYRQQLELLRFQSAEIANARLEPEEDQLLEQEHARGRNLTQLLQSSQAALELLGESDSCVLNQAGAVGRALQQIQRLDASAAGLVQLHEQTVAALRELQTAVSKYAERLEVDPARFSEVEQRLNLLQSLKHKYGPLLAQVIAFGREVEKKRASLENRDQAMGKLNEQSAELEREAWTSAIELSSKRQRLIPKLSKAVSQQLSDLGFKQSRFEISIRTAERSEFAGQLANASLHGVDTIEFQFAPNPGESIRPLRAIASSGELARVMLALKTVLAVEDQVPVLVFDEVDANIGGETARAVGDKMREIAIRRQVLCITHLPQVAASASSHFLVSKAVRAGRTISEITLLESKARVTELARMLGGQTEAARKHAQALLKEGD